jgi:3-methyladenine DNA glycosylase AlkC
VRRLVSEGTRPRLPWGVRLPLFIEQPNLVIPLLLVLRDDDEEYVRRSVANHLNDIAKDHPQLVIEIAQQWLAPSALEQLNNEQEKNRMKLVRHGCRTLFKQGEPKVMALFGYGDVDDLQCNLKLLNEKVAWGSELVFECSFSGKEVHNSKNNKYMIDYIVHYQKANGKLALKVFEWLDRKDIVTSDKGFQKKHSFKAISTRKHYPGIHKLEVVINGIKKAKLEFELLTQDGLD